MFDLNPLHTPNAALQQAIMLFVAGTLGFIIGYLSRKRLIGQLEGDLASTRRDLADCHQMPAGQVTNFTDDEAVLRRISARTGELNFSRIGLATATDADDLKVIVGVGPFLEKKLHAIGIYTFRQIAGLSGEDVTKVNEIIEFFPGRIERDDWVGQAAKLAKHT